MPRKSDRIKAINKLLYGERLGRARFHRWGMWAHYDWACRLIHHLRKERQQPGCAHANCIMRRVETNAFNSVGV